MAKILIVDDDQDTVDSMSMILKQNGHETDSAGNREDGIRMAMEGCVDLMILDIMMEEPDDGIVVAQELRRKGFTKPIIIMSAISKATGLKYGQNDAITPVNDFIEKPVKPDMLLKKVEEFLAK